MNQTIHRKTCRLCDSNSLELVLPILPSAIGDAFVTEAELEDPQGIYPLATYLCLDCGHLQNLDIVDPEVLFRNYTYKTSASMGLVKHFQAYAANVVSHLSISPDTLVVEIGSNDGSLLKAFKSHGLRVQGVDPAKNIAANATAEGVPTIPDFFTSAIAKRIVDESGHAALFCANNVFAHADNMADIVSGIRTVLAEDGVFVFEVSYVPDIIDSFVFDTIYHEHVSHHALQPLEKFFNRLDMSLFDVEKVPTKGGSIRGFAQPKSTGKRSVTERLQELYRIETERGICKPEIYHAYFNEIEKRKKATLQYLDQAIAEGKTIAGYGASTTTTTLVYHFELGSKLQFIFDDNPVKHGLFSPGWHIPVLPSAEMYVRKPDIVVILAWMYSTPIVERHQAFINEGGKFLIPLPEMLIVEC